jgi:hypothetical protein
VGLGNYYFVTTMGLGINIKGKIKKPLLAFKKESVDLARLQGHITNHSSGVFKDFLFFEQNENILYATLHPCEEPVNFELADNIIICSAKTNSVGPGYHAYLVELIERLGETLNIQWEWNLEEGDVIYEDETGYYNHRDFKKLQLEMLQWLTTLARSFTEGDGHQYMVAFPLGYPRMCHDYFAVSPMQVWTKEWFDHVATTDIEHLEKEGAEFFIWWNSSTSKQVLLY